MKYVLVISVFFSTMILMALFYINDDWRKMGPYLAGVLATLFGMMFFLFSAENPSIIKRIDSIYFTKEKTLYHHFDDVVNMHGFMLTGNPNLDFEETETSIKAILLYNSAKIMAKLAFHMMFYWDFKVSSVEIPGMIVTASEKTNDKKEDYQIYNNDKLESIFEDNPFFPNPSNKFMRITFPKDTRLSFTCDSRECVLEFIKPNWYGFSDFNIKVRTSFSGHVNNEHNVREVNEYLQLVEWHFFQKNKKFFDMETQKDHKKIFGDFKTDGYVHLVTTIDCNFNILKPFDSSQYRFRSWAMEIVKCIEEEISWKIKYEKLHRKKETLLASYLIERLENGNVMSVNNDDTEEVESISE